MLKIRTPERVRENIFIFSDFIQAKAPAIRDGYPNPLPISAILLGIDPWEGSIPAPRGGLHPILNQNLSCSSLNPFGKAGCLQKSQAI